VRAVPQGWLTPHRRPN
jgi:hypothetical protein